MSYTAARDSLGLADFLALDQTQREDRRNLARQYRDQSQSAGRADIRIQKMTNAAGLAPDDPDPWLRLARVWRWLGDYLQADKCLTNAASAVSRMNTDRKAAAALETALQRAWLHYDRGEWREAMPWVRAAMQLEHGNVAVQQIRGLLESIQGKRGMAHQISADLRRKDPFTTDNSWIMANLDISRGRYREAYNFFTNLEPGARHAAECYRDMGRMAERVGDWTLARKWYGESVAVLPFRHISCLRKISAPRISDEAGKHKLPFWLAFDQYYVTGSLSAYLNYALNRYEQATTAVERERWGGMVVNAAGICLRLEMEKSEVRRARGVVFAGTGRTDRALVDLRAAVKDYKSRGRPVWALEKEIGHLLMLQEDHAAAIGYLRRALVGDPKSAQAWSDLGLALIMEGNQAEAGEALTQAITLDKNLAAAWYNRGLMHLHADDLDRAESDLVEAAQLAPDNRNVAKLLQQVMQQKRRR